MPCLKIPIRRNLLELMLVNVIAARVCAAKSKSAVLVSLLRPVITVCNVLFLLILILSLSACLSFCLCVSLLLYRSVDVMKTTYTNYAIFNMT